MHTLVDLVARIKYAATGVDTNENIHPLMAKLPPSLKKVRNRGSFQGIVCLS